MAKKQKSFADKASGNKNKDSVFVKYVKSIQSEKTGGWRFNEQIIQMQKGEQLTAALKRMDQVANLVDIDLSQFSNSKENEDDNVEAKEELVECINPELPNRFLSLLHPVLDFYRVPHTNHKNHSRKIYKSHEESN